MTKCGWGVRKAAQRSVSLAGKACAECGSTHRLQRHHPDYTKPTHVVILCQACHVRADLEAGTRKTKQPKVCKVCGKDFMPSHSKKHNTCNPECLSAIGRMNAMKRWGSGKKIRSIPAGQRRERSPRAP